MKHYLDHMLPIYHALPPEIQGEIRPRTFEPVPGRVALVASWQDLEPLRGHHPYIYVEHGAGQAYTGDEKSALQPGYSGSGGYRHHGCLGFICPSQTVADRWTTAPTAVVGCPKMDAYLNNRCEPIPKTVCFVWHWDSKISQEASSAWPHYRDQLPTIVNSFEEQGWTVWMHPHPKWDGALNQLITDTGARLVANPADVLTGAAMMVADNTSLAYEFALLDKPVFFLNAPWYRRDVHHGLRFWSEIPGITIDEPTELLDVQLDHAHEMMHTPVWRNIRNQVNERVYAYRDGTSSQRAAEFVATLLAR